MMPFEILGSVLLARRNNKSLFTWRVTEERFAEEFGTTRGVAVVCAQREVYFLEE